MSGGPLWNLSQNVHAIASVAGVRVETMINVEKRCVRVARIASNGNEMDWCVCSIVDGDDLVTLAAGVIERLSP
jgi:hypothetical protein